MLAGYIGLQAKNQKPVYLNPKAPIEERVKDALSRMTPLSMHRVSFRRPAFPAWAFDS